MLSQSLRSAIRPTSLILLMIWAGEFSSFAIYYFIAHRAASRSEVMPDSADQMLPMLFGALAGVSLLAGLGLKWFTFSQHRAQAFLSRQMPAANETTGDDPSLIALAKKTFQLYIMSLGMINSCILFGMVLAITQRSLSVFTPFLIGTVIGAIVCFPRLEAFIEESSITWNHSSKRRTPQ